MAATVMNIVAADRDLRRVPEVPGQGLAGRRREGMNAMKRVFALFFLLFLVYVRVAEGTLERPKQDGIVRLRWATDDNPARKVQTDLFRNSIRARRRRSILDGRRPDKAHRAVRDGNGAGHHRYGSADDGLAGQTRRPAGSDAVRESDGVRSRATPIPRSRRRCRIDGKQYRFPCNVWANCVIYNKRIFDDHGVPYPKTGLDLRRLHRASQADTRTPQRAARSICRSPTGSTSGSTRTC